MVPVCITNGSEKRQRKSERAEKGDTQKRAKEREDRERNIISEIIQVYQIAVIHPRAYWQRDANNRVHLQRM